MHVVNTARNQTDEIIEEMIVSGIADCFDMRAAGKHIGAFLDKLGSGGGSIGETVQWLDDQRAENHIFVKREGLNMLSEWRLDSGGAFAHRKKRFFRIVGLKVSSTSREVSSWCQPILDNEGSGIIGLLVRKSGAETHFLMQAKADVGNRNIVQLGPTVQYNPGNYIDNEKIKKPFLFDEFLEPKRFIMIGASRQAEEGGRFYQEEHIHRILMLPENLALDLPDNFRWMPESCVRFLLHFGDIVNSSRRHRQFLGQEHPGLHVVRIYLRS